MDQRRVTWRVPEPHHDPRPQDGKPDSSQPRQWNSQKNHAYELQAHNCSFQEALLEQDAHNDVFPHVLKNVKVINQYWSASAKRNWKR